MAAIHYFIGVDVSKSTLDFTILKDGILLLQEKIENQKEKIKSWIAEVTKAYPIKRSTSLFCLEHAGLYGTYLVERLLKQKANLWLESPLRIKRSLGMQRGKTDKIDSLRIAQYCYIHRHNFKQWAPARPEIEQLRLLSRLRDRIVRCRLQLLIAVKESHSYLKKRTSQNLYSHCVNSIEVLMQDLKSVEDNIFSLIKSDENLDRLNSILMSIPGIGKVGSVELLVATNEFRNFDSPKKFACYCGVAPFEHSSGVSTKGKSKISKIANIKVKTALHRCAVASIRNKGEMKDYYQRKLAEGKPKMAVVNIIRNKIIHRVFACVRDNRLYQNQVTTN